MGGWDPFEIRGGTGVGGAPVGLMNTLPQRIKLVCLMNNKQKIETNKQKKKFIGRFIDR